MRRRRLRLRPPGRLPRALALLVCLVLAVVPAAGFRMCIDGDHIAFGAIDAGCPCAGMEHDHDPSQPCSDVSVELPDVAQATPLGALADLAPDGLLAIGWPWVNAPLWGLGAREPAAQPPPGAAAHVPWRGAAPAARRTIVLQV
jgi:hypothetical protein